MSHICVVMAVHNRIDSVNLALRSWTQLQDYKDFSVVVADDGSTDDIESVAYGYGFDFPVYYCRREEGGNVAANLNNGTRHAPPETTHIWYTDGDILMNKDAMGWAYKHIEEYPDRTIIGRYDWLPSMVIKTEDVSHNFQGIIDCKLPRIKVPGMPQGRRPDHRIGTKRYGETFFDHLLFDNSRAILGANFIIPIKAFHDTGGWDEHISGSNANDCDFGWCLTEAGYGVLTCNHINGYHQFHQGDGAAKGEGARIALVYIFRKHGQELPPLYQPYIEKEKQWRKDHGWPEA